MANAIEAFGLVKKYGKVTALAGLDLAAAEGTVLGVLGPNGAGKTTAVSILTTLIEPDAGEATIAGIDLRKDPHGVRSRIGLSGQAVAVDEQLTGFENLDMIGRLYHLGRDRARVRARELLEVFDLVEAGDRPVKSGACRAAPAFSASAIAGLEVCCAGLAGAISAWAAETTPRPAPWEGGAPSPSEPIHCRCQAMPPSPLWTIRPFSPTAQICAPFEDTKTSFRFPSITGMRRKALRSTG